MEKINVTNLKQTLQIARRLALPYTVGLTGAPGAALLYIVVGLMCWPRVARVARGETIMKRFQDSGLTIAAQNFLGWMKERGV